MSSQPTSDETQLRVLVAELTEGVRTKDVARATAPYADAPVLFVLAPPLQYVSGDNAPGSSGLAEWFASFQDDTIGQESRELTITAGPDVAFAHRLLRISGTRTDGQQTNIWVRETLGFRKLAGKWTITHQHQSVPMYMDGSERAALDLQP